MVYLSNTGLCNPLGFTYIGYMVTTVGVPTNTTPHGGSTHTGKGVFTMGTTTKPGTTKPGTTKGTPKGTTTTPKGGYTFVKPPKVTPQNRKGSSTIPNPVGNTWVTCLNLTLQNGGVPPKRSVLVHKVMGLGVTYYTARTQVNRYLQWVSNGSNPQGLPKGVTPPTG